MGEIGHIAIVIEPSCRSTTPQPHGAFADRYVDDYIARSEQWPSEMAALRAILLDGGLSEEIKWRKPCYSSGRKNIAILQEMNDFLALMFFKGALLDDMAGVLEEQGPNSRSARRMTFRSVDDVERLAAVDEPFMLAAAIPLAVANDAFES